MYVLYCSATVCCQVMGSFHGVQERQLFRLGEGPGEATFSFCVSKHGMSDSSCRAQFCRGLDHEEAQIATDHPRAVLKFAAGDGVVDANDGVDTNGDGVVDENDGVDTNGDGVIDSNDGATAISATPAPLSDADAEASGNGAMSTVSLPAGSVYAGVVGLAAMTVGGVLLL